MPFFAARAQSTKAFGFTSGSQTLIVESLLIAGGGGGANGYYGGGAGAGGLLYTSGIVLDLSQTYTFAIGSGGAAGTNGSNTTGLGYTAIGGGTGSATGGSGVVAMDHLLAVVLEAQELQDKVTLVVMVVLEQLELNRLVAVAVVLALSVKMLPIQTLLEVLAVQDLIHIQHGLQ